MMWDCGGNVICHWVVEHGQHMLGHCVYMCPLESSPFVWKCVQISPPPIHWSISHHPLSQTHVHVGALQSPHLPVYYCTQHICIMDVFFLVATCSGCGVDGVGVVWGRLSATITCVYIIIHPTLLGVWYICTVCTSKICKCISSYNI